MEDEDQGGDGKQESFAQTRKSHHAYMVRKEAHHILPLIMNQVVETGDGHPTFHATGIISEMVDNSGYGQHLDSKHPRKDPD